MIRQVHFGACTQESWKQGLKGCLSLLAATLVAKRRKQPARPIGGCMDGNMVHAYRGGVFSLKKEKKKKKRDLNLKAQVYAE